jgi:hypothetical protein
MLFDTVSLVLETARHPTNPKYTILVYLTAAGRRESLLAYARGASFGRILALGGDPQ